MNKKFLLPLAVVGSLLAGTSVHAATVVAEIDPLSQTQSEFSVGGVIIPSNPVNVSGGLLDGLTRTLDLNVVTDGGNVSSILVPAGGGNDGLSLNNDTFMESDGLVGYGNFAARDFTVGGTADRFIFNVLTNDQLGNGLFVTVNGETRNIVPTFQNPDVPQQIEFLFSQFSTDLASVTSFELGLNAIFEGDIAIDLFAVGNDTQVPPTPEPATMLGLLAVGAMGFASRRRQK